MGSFSDFLRHANTGKPKRLYWVCGEEEVLRLDAAARIREIAGAAGFDTSRISATEIPESEIWAHLNQHPLDGDRRRLLVVTDAQALRQLDRLSDWAADSVHSRNATAVFLADAAEPPEQVPPGAVVRCTLPKDPDGRLRRAVEILRGWGSVDPTTAGVLLKRVDFDLREARAVLAKASLFPDSTLTVRAVEMLAPRRADADVVWHLIALSKRAAAEALVEGGTEPGVVLGALTTHVEALGRLNAVQAGNPSIRELAHRTGLREGYVRLLAPHARLYSRRETTRRTLLLYRLDNAYQRGARDGVLASLIALW